MLMHKAGYIVLPMLLMLGTAQTAKANSATISFSGQVLPACEIASPDRAAEYNPNQDPSLMVVRCNYGSEFQVVSAVSGGGNKSGKATAEGQLVTERSLGDRLTMRWVDDKLDSAENEMTVLSILIVP